jgi:Glycosyl transferase family 2
VSAVSAVRPVVPALAPSAPRHEAARRTPRRAHPRARSRRSACPTISVVVPARNEARNLEIVLPAIAAVRPLVDEIIVVDGNSTDGTIAAARRALPWVRVIRQTRRGKGNAMACGFAAATGDVIVMFDADGSADPAEIPTFVAALVAGADFAKGSRFATGGGSDDITLLRRTGNAGLNGVANALFGTSHTDLCYGYNAFWADLLPLLDLPDPTTPAPLEGMLWGDGFEIETVLNCRVAAAGLHITEVPSVERQRLFGRTNLRTFADGTRVLRTLLAERRRAVRQRMRGAGRRLVAPRLATEGFGIWAGAHRAAPVGPERVNGRAVPVDEPGTSGDRQLDAMPSAEGYRDAAAIGEALALTPSGGVAVAPREPLDAGHAHEEEPS